ncbi:MAG TPA: hypothetical protein VD833_16270, partial [Vicinamibacterales bacterium]|nr:hypothetical protein [Vicinamibacterales bacterium]
MQNRVLSRLADARLPTYVVWVPMSRGVERDVPAATAEVPDARATHYWDGGRVLVNGYRDTLGLPEDAWDIFLLYRPGVRWESAQPPVPDYWMHQLGSASRPRVDGPFLDAGRFLLETRQLLSRPAARA